ncbi:MAG: hypothetical protein R3C32_05615 [Chloroflexota bacterium]
MSGGGAASVMTVRGPVSAMDLGITLPHEHVFVDLLREYRAVGLLADEALAAEELTRFRDAGGTTLVDCTSEGIGRRPDALRRVSEATGIAIVMGSGHYRRPYLDEARIDASSVDALADGIVRDLEMGADGTDVRAGIIGEIGCDRFMSAVEERAFRAAARAHRRTGVTITTHAALAGRRGAARPAGGGGRRPIPGHRGPLRHGPGSRVPPAAGASGRVGPVRHHPRDPRTGHASPARVDRRAGGRGARGAPAAVARRVPHQRPRAYGGPGYAYLLTGFRELMAAHGLPEGLIATLLVDNPRRALTGAD